jgi:hypothetical protein
MNKNAICKNSTISPMLKLSSNKQKEDMMLHDKYSKLDYVQNRKADYWRARVKAKGVILDEVEKLTGYTRHYSALLLRSHHNLTKPKPVRKRFKNCIYGPAVRSVVLAVRKAQFGACAELTQPLLVTMAEKLINCGEMARPDSDTMEKLRAISLSTVKRIFKTDNDRSYEKLKLHGGMTTPGTTIKAQVAVRVGFWDVTKPGYFEIDTVAHNGGDPNGTFIYTVNMTDVVTGWTEPEAIMGKGELATVNAINDMKEDLPYAMVGLDSDGGSEFINWHLHRYCKRHKLNFTRSRSGQSNDNAHVEEKNRVVVRRLVGHARYDTPEQLAITQELYRGPWRLYYNFFLPTRKVTNRSYDKVTGKARYTYDAARTPYQRVLDHSDIPEEVKTKLRKEYDILNPITLMQNINRLEKKLMKTLKNDDVVEDYS